MKELDQWVKLWRVGVRSLWVMGLGIMLRDQALKDYEKHFL